VQWERVLATLQEELQEWLQVQSTWLALEPIFASDDIMRQLPAEGAAYGLVPRVVFWCRLTVG
jgi:dynein heavy chain